MSESGAFLGTQELGEDVRDLPLDVGAAPDKSRTKRFTFSSPRAAFGLVCVRAADFAEDPAVKTLVDAALEPHRERMSRVRELELVFSTTPRK